METLINFNYRNLGGIALEETVGTNTFRKMPDFSEARAYLESEGFDGVEIISITDSEGE